MYGITGAAAAVAIGHAVTFGLTLVYAYRLIRFSPLEWLLMGRQTLIACLPFAAVSLIPRQPLRSAYGLALLSLCVSIVLLIPQLKSLLALWRAR